MFKLTCVNLKVYRIDYQYLVYKPSGIYNDSKNSNCFPYLSLATPKTVSKGYVVNLKYLCDLD